MIQQSALLIINFGLLVIEMNEKIKVRIEGDKKNKARCLLLEQWKVNLCNRSSLCRYGALEAKGIRHRLL